MSSVISGGFHKQFSYGPIDKEFNQARLRAAAATYVKDKGRETFRRIEEKVGRNEPCPCGSGKKFKRCHWDSPFAGRYR